MNKTVTMGYARYIGRVGALAVMLGAGIGLGVLSVGTASADDIIGCNAAGATLLTTPGTADCDAIQHGELSISTINLVDGQGWIDGQGVEDYDGTQGDWRTAPRS